MQFILVASFIVVASAAPQYDSQYDYPLGQQYRPLTTLKDQREDYGDGNFRYEFLTENGINVGARGTPGVRGQSNIDGYYSFPHRDGSYSEVRYIADEFGYRADSRLIPTQRYYNHNFYPNQYTEEQRRLRGLRPSYYG